MKNRSILLCTAALCTLFLSACGSSDAPMESVGSAEPLNDPISVSAANSDHHRELTEYGRLERLRMDVPGDAPVAVRAKNFTISAQEVAALAAEYRISLQYDEAAALEKSRKQLIERHALYAYARQNDAVVSDEVLDAMIADAQDSDETSPAEFEAFLKGFQGDEALYWQFHREDLRMLESIEAMKETARKVYEGNDFEAHYAAWIADVVAAEEAEILE